MAGGEWREWVPLTPLLDQVPQQVQRGLTTSELQLTCLACLPHHLALGTSVGLVYLAHLPSLHLVRLKCENPVSGVSVVGAVRTVDDMLAAGTTDGAVTIFQLPRPNHNNNSNASSPASIKRFTVSSIHRARVTSLAWSRNGMRLFTGDEAGVVAMVDINYQTLQCTARQILKEESSITQLAYSQQRLAVSTLDRALIYHTATAAVTQVGQKPRKHRGMFGCAWAQGGAGEATLYTSRPGLRVWSANVEGEVQHTHIIKELPERAEMPLLNPSLEKPRTAEQFAFGLLHALDSSHLLTHNQHWLFVIDIQNLKVLSYSGRLRNINSVAVCENEIFVLEGPRSVSCLSTKSPDVGKKQVPRQSLFPDPQNLVGIKDKLLHQGSGLLDQLARVSSTVAAKVTEHATPAIITGLDGRRPSDCGTDRPRSSSAASLHHPASTTSPTRPYSSTSRPFSPAASSPILPPRMVQSVSSFFPSLIASQLGKPPTIADLQCPGEKEGVEELEESVSSAQIVAGDDADAEPLVTRLPRKKNKKRYDATPSPDTMSISSYKSSQSDGSEAVTSEAPSTSPPAITQGASHSPPDGTLDDRECDVTEHRPTLDCGVRVSVTATDDLDGVIDLQADNRTYEDFKTNIEQNESLLAHLLDLSCLRMDHESKEGGEDHQLPLEREHSVESGERTPSTIKEASPNPEDPNFRDFFAQFHTQTSFSSYESGEERAKKDSLDGNSLCDNGRFDGNSLASDSGKFDGNSLGDNGGERIESNTSEDRLSCLSYGPPSGSSLLSLPGNRHHGESGQELEQILEPRTMITVNDSSEVADISWSYSAVEESHEYDEEQMTGGWIKQKIPSDILSLGVSENAVTFLDSHGNLYFKPTNPKTNQTWRKVKLTPKATDIALSPNNSLLWILSESQAYAVGSPALESVSPAKMVVAARDVRQVCVDDGAAWYIHTNGKVCAQLSLSSNTPSSKALSVACRDHRLAQLACRAGVVWGVTEEGQMVFRIGVTSQTPLGQEWGVMKGPGGPPTCTGE